MDLHVTLKGQSQNLVLKNPVIAASGTFGSGLEYASFGDLANLGGISVKGLSLKPRPGNPEPRIVETPAGMLNAIGLQNDGIEDFLRVKLPQLPWSETAIIANLYGKSAEEFAELAAMINGDERVAALEINVSCPNVAAGGALFGADPGQCSKVVECVRKNAPAKHIMVKLSPNVTDIAAIAAACERAGADSISCINTLSGMAIDLAKRKPALGNIFGGLSGPAIRPVALRCVWQVSHAVSLPVVGIGGISTPEHILEFLVAGAKAVQVGTANFMRPDSCFRLARELPDAIRKYGGESLADFSAASLRT